MSNTNKHNELDQFLREKFEGHTIEPHEDLWKGIEQRFAPRVVPMHKYSRLKLALYSSAAVIAGLVVMLVVLKTENQNAVKKEVSGIVQEKATPDNSSEIQIQEENAKENIVLAAPKNIAVPTEIRKNPVHSEKNQATESITAKPEKTGERNYSVALLPLQKFTAGELNYFTQPGNENLKTVSPRSINPENTRITKPARSNRKIHTTNFRSKPKYISAKKYYAQKSKSMNSGNSGSRFENFDLRANLSPVFNTRLLNNLQNAPTVNYSPAFYNDIENGRITLNGGLELAYNFNSNWSVYSGLKFSRYSQYIQTIKNQYEIVSDNQIVVPASAGNIGLGNKGIGQLAYQSEVGTNLKLQYLDFPLVARYKMNGRFFVDAGMKFSYLLSDKTTAKIMDSDAIIQVEKITGLQKNNFGIILGAGMEQTMRSGFRYEFGPEINLNLTNINPSASVITKPVSFGFRATIYFGRFYRN